MPDFDKTSTPVEGIEEVHLQILTPSTGTTTTMAGSTTSSPVTSVTSDNDTAITPDDTQGYPSYQSIYTSPPPVAYPYQPTEALGDLPGVSYALEMFLASHMVESEDYCNKSDIKKFAIRSLSFHLRQFILSQRTAIFCYRLWTNTMCKGADVVC